METQVRSWAMPTGVRLALLAGLLFLVGCARGPRHDTEAQLLQSCFDAIQKNDWQGYSQLTITSADIIQKMLEIESNLSETKPIHLIGLLKPEELKRHREDFERVVAGGRGFINFKHSKFISIGSVIKQGDAFRGMNGGSVPSKTYSLRIQIRGDRFDSIDLYPLFTIVRWEGKWRLLSLHYMEDPTPANDTVEAYMVSMIRARDDLPW